MTVQTAMGDTYVSDNGTVVHALSNTPVTTMDSMKKVVGKTIGAAVLGETLGVELGASDGAEVVGNVSCTVPAEEKTT